MSNCAFGVYGTLVDCGGEGVLLMGSGKTSVASQLGEIVADDVLVVYLQHVTYDQVVLYGQRVAEVDPLRSKHPRGTVVSKKERMKISKLIYLCPDSMPCTAARIEPWELYYLCNQFYNQDFAFETDECAQTFMNLLNAGQVEVYTVPWESNLLRRVEVVRKVLDGGVGKKAIFDRYVLRGSWEYAPFQKARWECEVVAPADVFQISRENVVVAVRWNGKVLKYRFKLCRVWEVALADGRFPDGWPGHLVRYVLWQASRYVHPCQKYFVGVPIGHVEKPHHSKVKRFRAFVKILNRLIYNMLE